MKKTLLKSSILLAAFFMLISMGINAQNLSRNYDIKPVVKSFKDMNMSAPTVDYKAVQIKNLASEDSYPKFKSTTDAANIKMNGYAWGLQRAEGFTPPVTVDDFYTFNPFNEESSYTKLSSINDDLRFWTGTSDGEKYYAIRIKSTSSGTITNWYYTVYDVKTWDQISHEEIKQAKVLDVPYNLSYDPVSKRTLALNSIYDEETKSWSQFFHEYDLETHTGSVPSQTSHPFYKEIFAAISSNNGGAQFFALMDAKAATGQDVKALVAVDATTFEFKGDYFTPDGILADYAFNFQAHGQINNMNWIVSQVEQVSALFISSLVSTTDGGQIVNIRLDMYQDGSVEESFIEPENFRVLWTGAFSPEIITSISNPTINENKFNVYGTAGSIEIKGVEGEKITVYSIDGRQVYNGLNTTIPVAKGIYVVKVGDQTEKVIVK